MPANEQKMGFEGLIFYGVAGSTAGGLIPETRDMSMTFSTDKGNTTTREADGSVPIETERVTVRKFQFDFQVLDNPTNATIAALLAASFAGTPVAFKSRDFTTGKGFDGDVILEHKHGMSLRGEQSLDFTAKPTKSAGRTPSLYVTHA